MEKYKCVICGFVYDPEEGDPDFGIKPGIPFANLPNDYICPICGAGKDEFIPLS
jgi:rubredoxin